MYMTPIRLEADRKSYQEGTGPEQVRSRVSSMGSKLSLSSSYGWGGL